MVVRLPGACRIRSTEPGDVDSNPSGAVYHGSREGGWGVGLSRVGKVKDRVAKRKTDNTFVQNILEVQVLKLLRRSIEAIRLTRVPFSFYLYTRALTEVYVLNISKVRGEKAKESDRLLIRLPIGCECHRDLRLAISSVSCKQCRKRAGSQLAVEVVNKRSTGQLPSLASLPLLPRFNLEGIDVLTW